MSQSVAVTFSSISKVLSNSVIPKALGIACFSVDENGKSVTKLQDVILFLISVVIGILVCYFSVIIRSDLVAQQSRIASIGNFLAFIASVVIIILSMLIIFIFRHKIWSLAQKLDDIEEKFQEIGLKMNFERMLQLYALICSAILLIIFALEYFLYAIDEHPIIYKVILHLYSTLYLTLNVGVCTASILAIIVRLKRINCVCKSLLIHGDYERKVTKVRTINKHDDDEMETIGKLYEIYSLCIDVCDLINLCFMFQVMLGYGLVFFHTIFVSFTVYKDFSTFGYLLPETTCSLAFCLYYNLFLILIIAMCHGAEQEAQLSLKLANEMIKQSKDMNKTLMLVTFTTLIKKRGPKFTCGLFDFDWRLVFANISSAATNFVILMQFDMASKQR